MKIFQYEEAAALLADSRMLQQHISRIIYEKNRQERLFAEPPRKIMKPSAVLVLLGENCGDDCTLPGPCLILNKRSRHVPQPGDLCCPGGSLDKLMDPFLSRLLSLPAGILDRSFYNRKWRQAHPAETRQIRLFLAAGLRESFEEMRLNPLKFSFMGPLPPERLSIFCRMIYPLAGWVRHQQQFVTNGEVEKVIYIPLRAMLDPDRYACYRIEYSPKVKAWTQRRGQDFPCFVYEHGDGAEMLWGATFRIITEFLELIFGFIPPAPETLPVISRRLDRNYLTGDIRPDRT